MSAEARVARGSDGKPYPQSCCSWKVKYTKWQKWFNSKNTNFRLVAFCEISPQKSPNAKVCVQGENFLDFQLNPQLTTQAGKVGTFKKSLPR